MNKQNIFKAAHKLAKTTMSKTIKYSVRLSIALKKVYASVRLQNESTESFEISVERHEKHKQTFIKNLGGVWNHKRLTWTVSCKKSELKGKMGLDLTSNIASQKVATANTNERMYDAGQYAYEVLSGEYEEN